ncbi:MAG: molybdate ABC transporter substrate-binding protein [Gemmobacter sp.]|nr:molybdate ABC transporter substrate-binding protein [Gemmobacter sp.]
MSFSPCFKAALVAVVLSAGPSAVSADTALVAVAANFADAAETLSPMFTAATGHDLKLTTGSTGKLYAQIGEGAPFEVLLSADAKTPAKLEDEGKAVAGSRFTYAVGQVALYSANPETVGVDGKAALENPDLRFIAIANPDLAPYGGAAREAMQAMGLWDTLVPKIVMGQNIGQTFSLVSTGAAEVGFVALSAVKAPGKEPTGSYWQVPQEMFTPIRQDALLLQAGAANPAAAAFLDFLKSPEALAVIVAYGYGAGN